MTREEADRLLVPTGALPKAKLPQSPRPRQGQSREAIVYQHLAALFLI